MKAVAIVLDSVGLGYLPDAPLFGDEGADTLDHTVLKTGITLPHLAGLGLGIHQIIPKVEVLISDIVVESILPNTIEVVITLIGTPTTTPTP